MLGLTAASTDVGDGGGLQWQHLRQIMQRSIATSKIPIVVCTAIVTHVHVAVYSRAICHTMVSIQNFSPSFVDAANANCAAYHCVAIADR